MPRKWKCVDGEPQDWANFEKDCDVQLKEWVMSLTENQNIETLWRRWLDTVNRIAEDNIGFSKGPVEVQDRTRQRQRDTHSLIQEKKTDFVRTEIAQLERIGTQLTACIATLKIRSGPLGGRRTFQTELLLVTLRKI